MTSSMRTLPLFFLTLCVVACDCGKPEGGGGGGPTVNRCEFDVENSPLFSRVGSGASAAVMATDADGIAGQFSQGRAGDVLLQNDRIRVVIQKPGRHIGPTPYGGFLIDADIQRTTPGQDSFGRFAFFYAFGRTVNASDVEVVADGSNGGPAVVAVTGTDVENDYVNVQNVIGDFFPGTKLVVDPNKPLPVRATTYYVLSPGESRVRVLTNFCNDGNTPVQIPLGELVEQGGTSSFFNPTSCTNRPGFVARDGKTTCIANTTTWFGYQADGVAYALRTYKTSDPTVVEDKNAAMAIAGVVGVLVGGEDETGLLSWTNPSARDRPASFAIGEGGQKSYLRDFVVARDLGEVHSTFLALDSTPRARLNVQVDGAGAASSRVEVVNDAGRTVTILVSDENGRSKVDLVPGAYTLTAGVQSGISAQVNVSVPSTGSVEATLTLPVRRKLTVTVKDPANVPQPAKVTVFCPAGPCANANSWTRFVDQEFLPSNVAAIVYIPTSGTAELELIPEQYAVVVTRGPEYSAWPDTWRPVEPSTARAVDLSAASQSLDAVIARVVDTTGWMSADLHVHAVNSADSSVENELRVASFMSEGVDVLCSTDHDFVTDFAPFVQALNGTEYLATMVGDEISSFDWGHYNAFPMIHDPASPLGGAIDWAGGLGPTLRMEQLTALVREKHPDAVVQINHGRGPRATFTSLRVDTLTGASHVDPVKLRMEPAPGATATDTKAFTFDFDAMELQNGLRIPNDLLNDWFTFLSIGQVKTATSVSDTHKTYNVAAGYSRSWVKMDSDAVTTFSPAEFARRVKAHKLVGSNGPFLKLTAQKLESGTPTGPIAEVGDTLSVAAGSEVELTVDVQGPEWMQFDRIDLYTHAPGREAFDGVENNTDPVALQARTLSLATLPVEVVPGLAGNFRRMHVTEKFTVTADADTWFVVVIRSSSAVRTMFPLAWDGTPCGASGCDVPSARPFAFTNPVFIDADGSGSYDNFPLKPSSPPPSPLGSSQQPLVDPARYVPTLEEFRAFLKHVDPHHP